jgi:hypothetical protein
MECSYNEHVDLTGVLSEMLSGVGRISLCMRTRCRAFDRSEEVQIQLLLDGYKPDTRKFLN